MSLCACMHLYVCVVYASTICSLRISHRIASARYIAEMARMSALRDSSAQLAVQLAEREQATAQAETKVRIEHEWRTTLQEADAKSREHIEQLQRQIRAQQDEARQHERVRTELDKVRAQWSEAQQTLEELGIQLSVSKLQVSELQDASKSQATRATASSGGVMSTSATAAMAGGDAMTGGGQWTPDKMSSHCRGCNREFSITRRKVRSARFNVMLNMPFCVFSWFFFL